MQKIEDIWHRIKYNQSSQDYQSTSLCNW